MSITVEPNGHTLDGLFAKSTVSRKENQYVVNLTGQGDVKKVVRIVHFLFGPLQGVGVVKNAGMKKDDKTGIKQQMFCWVPGSKSQEKKPKPRVTNLPGLLLSLNAAQSTYKFELVYGTLLRIKIL